MSAYALSNDVTMLNKAREIADLIIPVFDTPTGIPYPSFNPFTLVLWNIVIYKISKYINIFYYFFPRIFEESSLKNTVNTLFSNLTKPFTTYINSLDKFKLVLYSLLVKI